MKINRTWKNPLEKAILILGLLLMVLVLSPGCKPDQDGMLDGKDGKGKGKADDKASRLVLAFYYPWYHTVEVSGYCSWRQGAGSDDTCEEDSASPRMPVGGLYDSSELEVIQRHFRESRVAGLDGWITSWWGIGHETDDNLELLLNQAQIHAPGFQISIYYEVIPGCHASVLCPELSPEEKIEALKEDFRYLQTKFFSHPSYHKVNGRPVVFVYMRAMFQGVGIWSQAIEEIRAEMDPNPFISGDSTLTFLDALVPDAFDQVHFYNPLLEVIPISPRRVDFEGFVNRVRVSGRSSALTVLPGYDDHLMIVREEALYLDREDGETYRQTWENAIAAKPDWILVTSFNEWYEGTEIEPSEELGDVYLHQTRTYVKRFKK